MNLYIGNLSHQATDSDLQQAFAAFGQVIEGMDIVRKIQAGQTGENEKIQLLKHPVKIMTVRRLE